MPLDAAIGISSSRDYRTAITQAVIEAKRNLKSGRASLALVFSTFDFAASAVIENVSYLIGAGIPIIGTTSNAILSANRFVKCGVAIVLFKTEGVHFTTACVKNILGNLTASGDALGKQLLSGAKDIPRRFVLYFSDGSVTNNIPFLKGLQQRLGISFPIVGAAGASDNIKLNKTYLYYNAESLDSSAVGILWSGNVNFGLGVKHGWRPIGKPRRVSAAQESTIKKIDNEPAISLYQDYFAKEIPDLKKELKRISSLYPLGLNISGEEEYILRNILGIRNDGALICRDEIPENSNVRLMIATEESCLNAAEEAAKEAKETLLQRAYPSLKPARLILVFNSVSRVNVLRRKMAQELQAIKKVFPDTPLIGICTCAEQAPLKSIDFAGKTYCHSQTIVILAMN